MQTRDKNEMSRSESPAEFGEKQAPTNNDDDKPRSESTPLSSPIVESSTEATPMTPDETKTRPQSSPSTPGKKKGDHGGEDLACEGRSEASSTPSMSAVTKFSAVLPPELSESDEENEDLGRLLNANSRGPNGSSGKSMRDARPAGAADADDEDTQLAHVYRPQTDAGADNKNKQFADGDRPLADTDIHDEYTQFEDVDRSGAADADDEDKKLADVDPQLDPQSEALAENIMPSMANFSAVLPPDPSEPDEDGADLDILLKVAVSPRVDPPSQAAMLENEPAEGQSDAIHLGGDTPANPYLPLMPTTSDDTAQKPHAPPMPTTSDDTTQDPHVPPMATKDQSPAPGTAPSNAPKEAPVPAWLQEEAAICTAPLANNLDKLRCSPPYREGSTYFRDLAVYMRSLLVLPFKFQIIGSGLLGVAAFITAVVVLAQQRKSGIIVAGVLGIACLAMAVLTWDMWSATERILALLELTTESPRDKIVGKLLQYQQRAGQVKMQTGAVVDYDLMFVHTYRNIAIVLDAKLAVSLLFAPSIFMSVAILACFVVVYIDVIPGSLLVISVMIAIKAGLATLFGARRLLCDIRPVMYEYLQDPAQDVDMEVGPEDVPNFRLHLNVLRRTLGATSERQAIARAGLSAAVSRPKIGALRHAVEEGWFAGLPEHELAEAFVAKVDTAIRSQDAEALQVAIEECRDAGMPEQSLEKAIACRQKFGRVN